MHEPVRENSPADEISVARHDGGNEWYYEWNPPDHCRGRVHFVSALANARVRTARSVISRTREFGCTRNSPRWPRRNSNVRRNIFGRVLCADHWQYRCLAHVRFVVGMGLARSCMLFDVQLTYSSRC
jgi:hypothetical protein